MHNLKNKPSIMIIFLVVIFSNSVIGSLFSPLSSIVEATEKILIENVMSNCTEGKILTLTEYDNLKAIAKVKLETMTMTHHVGTEKITYRLNNAHNDILASTKYDRNLPMVLLVHGFFGSLFSSNYLEIANALKVNGCANVFTTDNTIMMSDTYYAASTNAIITGEFIGEMLCKLFAGGIKKIHLIGHSLGAHACGFAGKLFQKNTNTKLNRITGLDPAGPCFVFVPPEKRLTTTDADFVDIIHSDCGSFGLSKSIGHVEENGGEHMPGCILASCNHNKCPFYYAESVNNNQFLAVQCNDMKTFQSGSCAGNPKTVMGHWTPSTATGNYYLITNENSKYAKGEQGTVGH